MLATIVDWNALLKVVLYSLVVGVGITIAFSLAIAGITRFAEMRRDGRVASAGAFALLGAIGLMVSAAAIVFGIVELTTKK